MSRKKLIETFETSSDWAVLNDETENIAAGTAPYQGTYCIEFDKASGDATLAAVYKTISAQSMKPKLHTWAFRPQDYICWLVNLSDLTDVDYVMVRLGKDASNYLEWRVADTSLTAARWTFCSARLGNAYVEGTGVQDWSEIDYIVVGVNFDANADTLTDMDFDYLYISESELA